MFRTTWGKNPNQQTLEDLAKLCKLGTHSFMQFQMIVQGIVSSWTKWCNFPTWCWRVCWQTWACCISANINNKKAMNCMLGKTSLFLKRSDTRKHMQVHTNAYVIPTPLHLQITGYCCVIFHATFWLLLYFSRKRLGVWDLMPVKTNYPYHYHQLTPINVRQMQKRRNIFYDSVQTSSGELVMTSSGCAWETQATKKVKAFYITPYGRLFPHRCCLWRPRNWCFLSRGHPALQTGGGLA